MKYGIDKEKLKTSLLGILLCFVGMYALITGTAGGRDYGDVKSVYMEGGYVRVLGALITAAGIWIIKKCFPFKNKDD